MQRLEVTRGGKAPPSTVGVELHFSRRRSGSSVANCPVCHKPPCFSTAPGLGETASGMTPKPFEVRPHGGGGEGKTEESTPCNMWSPRFGQARTFPFNWPCNLQQLGWIKGEDSSCEKTAGSGHLELGTSRDCFRSCTGGPTGRAECAGVCLSGWRAALLLD